MDADQAQMLRLILEENRALRLELRRQGRIVREAARIARQKDLGTAPPRSGRYSRSASRVKPAFTQRSTGRWRGCNNPPRMSPLR